jgi:eukaryotic-like serine/threonine-protein kinase
VAEPEPGATPEPPEPAREPAPGSDRARRLRRLRGMALLALLAVAAFAIGVLVFDVLLMPRFIHSAAEVHVPDLASLTQGQAERTLSRLGLLLERQGERFDPSVPPGYVLSQDPPPETLVRAGQRVMVTVSLGEESGVVPALEGESVRAATLVLTHAGLTVGGITRAPSNAVGIGLVAGSDPPAESVLPRNTPVSLLISTGLGEESWMMPELLGRDLDAARRELELDGLHVQVPPGAGAHGLVLFQNPPVGARLTRGQSITLRGSK